MPNSAASSIACDPHARMIDAWKSEGRLILQRCNACHKAIALPRTRCPNCWSADISDFAAAGRGIVTSYSLVYRGLPDHLANQAPIVIAEIALDEGVRLISRIVGDEAMAIKTGDRVKLVRRETAPQYPLPTFEHE